MPLNAYLNYARQEREKNLPISEAKKKRLKKEQDINDEIIRQLKVGGSESYCDMIKLFPIGLIPAPIRFPAWMFRKFPDNPEFELDDIEKVAMAHIIHFTNCDNPTGYIECAGEIENWCKCSVEEAHDALTRLCKKNLVEAHVLDPQYCWNHKRNLGYMVNIPYVHEILSSYGTDIWL